MWIAKHPYGPLPKISRCRGNNPQCGARGHLIQVIGDEERAVHVPTHKNNNYWTIWNTQKNLAYFFLLPPTFRKKKKNSTRTKRWIGEMMVQTLLMSATLCTVSLVKAMSYYPTSFNGVCWIHLVYDERLHVFQKACTGSQSWGDPRLDANQSVQPNWNPPTCGALLNGRLINIPAIQPIP